MKKIFIPLSLFFLMLLVGSESFAQGGSVVHVTGQRLDDGGEHYNADQVHFTDLNIGTGGGTLSPRGPTFQIPPALGAPAPSPSCPRENSTATPAANVISGNPVVLATGTKYLFQQDFTHASALGMSLSRTYRSEIGSFQFFGRHWTSSLQYAGLSQYGSLHATYLNGSQTPTQLWDFINFYLPDGGIYQFSHFMTPDSRSAVYLTPATLSKVGGNSLAADLTNIYLIYTDPSHIVVHVGNDEYDFSDNGSGRFLLDTIKKNGFTAYTYSYDGTARLKTITNALGATVGFTWGDGVHVTQVTAPDSSVWNYSYNGNGMLTTVTPPASSRGVVTYFYEDQSDSTLLTGCAIDGVRKTRYAYVSGKVVNSGTEDGEAYDTFVYDTDATTLTDVRGQSTKYTFQTVKGQRVLANVQTTATSSCPSATSSQVYDASGFLSQTTDFRGTKTTYSFNTDGILLSKTVAAGTPNAQTVTNTYVRPTDAPAGDLARVTTSDASGRGITQIDYTYVNSVFGRQIASATVTDLLTGASPRRQVFTYSLYANGSIQTKTVTTLLSSGSATETYSFDTAGNLISRIDAAGLTTTYSNYNGLGLPRQITDPNGVVTTIGYDSRGNPISWSTTGVGSRSATYAGDGQVESMSWSDGHETKFY